MKNLLPIYYQNTGIYYRHGGSFVQTLWRPTPPVSPQLTPQVTGQATGQAGLSLLAFFAEPKTSKEIQDALALRHRETFLDNYLTPMLDAGLLERTIPDKPTSPNQKYLLTAKGRTWLASAT